MVATSELPKISTARLASAPCLSRSLIRGRCPSIEDSASAVMSPTTSFASAPFSSTIFTAHRSAFMNLSTASASSHFGGLPFQSASTESSASLTSPDLGVSTPPFPAITAAVSRNLRPSRRGVSPSLVLAFASAPFSISHCAAFVCPCSEAK